MRPAFVLAALLLAAPAAAQDFPFELGADGLPPHPFSFPPAGLPLADPPTYEDGTPATERATQLVGELDTIRANLTRTRYVHEIIVSERHGVYSWDCSGMMQWLLERISPRAFDAVGYRRPLARHYARAIAAAPTGSSARGWENVRRVTDARPGDVFAWRRPRGMPGLDTGHVGIVISPATPVPGVDRAYAVRIADATRHGHQDDTRPDDGPGGFGAGTIVFLVDADGIGTHYGWRGTASEYYVETPIEIGRLH